MKDWKSGLWHFEKFHFFCHQEILSGYYIPALSYAWRHYTVGWRQQTLVIWIEWIHWFDRKIETTRHCTYNGFRSKSADSYTFLTFGLLSKNVLSSQAVKSFLSWSGSSSGHAETATLEVWEMGKFLHWLSIRCSVTSSHIASSLDLFESPHLYTLLHSLSTIPFNAELLRFCDSRGDLDDNVAARKLLICLALSTEWKH